jgi:hypothetical protein
MGESPVMSIKANIICLEKMRKYTENFRQTSQFLAKTATRYFPNARQIHTAFQAVRFQKDMLSSYLHNGKHMHTDYMGVVSHAAEVKVASR